MWIDSHAHLDDRRFDADRDQVVARAREAQVSGILTCGAAVESSAQAVALHQQYGDVWAAVGVHPHEAQSICQGEADACRVLPEALGNIEALSRRAGVVAIGEIGLDYHYDLSPRPAQRQALAAQLALASTRGLPVVLHCREAEDDLMAIVDAAPAGLRGVLHSFMDSERLAAWALARGFYLGITGFITFPKTETLAQVAAAAPLDRLLVETDCPYLAPHPFRGRRNEPAMVTHVAARLAQVRAMPLPALAAATTANAKELFGAFG